ncbi:tRNA pseudouridine synthase B [Candidatus Rickettsiella viridis]|uniref:tRNA pseudouridine synthase B n=1 Tax=Candidatus Rickettsiella viridis TaxID=676208 RepID=A0A2Z5UVL3_9COXI|nr:tRNA pseudouridine(55) synthase TruB [Candidatus Rickettsiella viridis]BBB15538.1 tRNA pseudouridine synthase B [Candidatus Rickettsiella viridis]
MHSQSLKPVKRTINGILLLDKPQGITSNQALQTAKRLFAAKKAGHTGSLDPLATGLLPLCFGEATKFSQFLLEADKAYWVSARLGIKTKTGDAEGEIIEERPIPSSCFDQLESVLSMFRGPILQIPPMFSALKFKGKPLYELARQGITVERSAREVTVHGLTLLGTTVDSIELEIKCTKGTYVRTLIEDIGEALGCGAYVQGLRRLGVANYNERGMISLQQLEAFTQEERDHCLLPLDSLLHTWPCIKLSQAAVYYLYQGQAILLPNVSEKGWVRLVHTVNDQFIGVGEVLEDGRVAPRRLIEQR